jgi:hypothetical protein
LKSQVTPDAKCEHLLLKLFPILMKNAVEDNVRSMPYPSLVVLKYPMTTSLRPPIMTKEMKYK